MFLVCLRATAPGALLTLLIVATSLSALAPAHAQPASAAPAASSAELTPAERAKRDAEKVFHWITIHGDKPRKPVAATPKEEKPPTVVRLKPPAPVAAPVAAATTPPAPTATTVAAAPPPQPEPTVPAPAAPVTASPPAAEVAVPSAAPTTSAPPVVVEDDASDRLVPVTQAEPRFPTNLVRTLRSGQVQVRFTVQTDGSVVEPVVVTTSNPRLNPAALTAVSQWRFAPLRKPQQGIVDLGFTAPE